MNHPRPRSDYAHATRWPLIVGFSVEQYSDGIHWVGRLTLLAFSISATQHYTVENYKENVFSAIKCTTVEEEQSSK